MDSDGGGARPRAVYSRCVPLSLNVYPLKVASTPALDLLQVPCFYVISPSFRERKRLREIYLDSDGGGAHPPYSLESTHSARERFKRHKVKAVRESRIDVIRSSILKR